MQKYNFFRTWQKNKSKNSSKHPNPRLLVRGWSGDGPMVVRWWSDKKRTTGGEAAEHSRQKCPKATQRTRAKKYFAISP